MPPFAGNNPTGYIKAIDLVEKADHLHYDIDYDLTCTSRLINKYWHGVIKIVFEKVCGQRTSRVM